MKTTRVTPRSTALLAASLLALSSLALPAPAAPNGEVQQRDGRAAERRADRERKSEHMAERRSEQKEKHLADLRASLKLTPAQTPAWDAYVAAIQAPQRDQTKREAGQREDWAQLKTPQRLDRMRALRQEHEAAMTRREDATRTFYAALNPEQQATFDARTASPFHGQERRGPGPR